MNVKEYLEGIARREYEIQTMQDRLDLLRSMAEGGSSPKMDDMPRGGKLTGSFMEKCLCKALDLEKEIQEKWDALEKDKLIIYNAAKTLSNDEYEALICLKYLDHRSWKDVAGILSRSVTWVYQTRDRAIAQLAQKLEVVA